MLKSLWAVAVSLALLSLAGVAHAAPTEVDGSRFAASGLAPLAQGCTDPAAVPIEEPTFLVKRGPGKPPLGQYSSGWRVSGDQFGAGTVTRMRSPSSLSDLRIAVNSPGGETQGSAVAIHHPTGDDGSWIGIAAMAPETRKGWHTVNAAGRTFTWAHYDSSGTVDGTGTPATIAAHATAYGDGEGADVGFLFGCNGKRFYTDRLRVVSDDDDLFFDYGGFRTRAELRLGVKKPKTTTITVGRRLDLKGRLFQKYPGGRLPGRLQFQSKPLKGGRWKTFRRESVGRNAPAEVSVGPPSNTAYRIAFPGSATFEDDVSNVLKVLVRMGVSASFVDPTITRGGDYAVVGKVRPAKRTGVQLQRYVEGSWRTIRPGTTASSTGSFRISGTAQDVGVSHWRVKVDGGATNADSVSHSFTLTVTDPPPSGNDDPPPPPPPEG